MHNQLKNCISKSQTHKLHWVRGVEIEETVVDGEKSSNKESVGLFGLLFKKSQIFALALTITPESAYSLQVYYTIIDTERRKNVIGAENGMIYTFFMAYTHRRIHSPCYFIHFVFIWFIRLL